MTQRYYAPELPKTEATIRLSEPESQHALRVMRLAVGDSLTVFDGLGHESPATVASISRNACECLVEGAIAVDRSPVRELQFAVALPKHDRARELIERLTELGVKLVVPLIAQRSQRGPSASSIVKLERAVIEACKQCGRNDLMTISPPLTTREFFGHSIEADDGLIAHGGPPASRVMTLDHLGCQWQAHDS